LLVSRLPDAPGVTAPAKFEAVTVVTVLEFPAYPTVKTEAVPVKPVPAPTNDVALIFPETCSLYVPDGETPSPTLPDASLII
jgi:hypothetical protein